MADHVIELLGNYGAQSVEALLQRCQETSYAVTAQGIYRVLRQLQEQNIVIKQKTMYSLHISWLLDVSFFSDQTQKFYLEQEQLHQLIPREPKEKRIWHFTNLLKVMDFTSQLLLSLAASTAKQVALRYTPHAWEVMIEPYKAARFTKQYLHLVQNRYMVVGGQSYLDKYTRAISDAPNNDHVYLAQPDEVIEKDRCLALDIIDDYILCTILDTEAAKAIDMLYSQVHREEDMYLLDIFRVFAQSTKIKLVLKRDNEKARQYRRRFEHLFGPLS